MTRVTQLNRNTRQQVAQTGSDPQGLSGEIAMLRTVMYRLAELARYEDTFESQAVVLRVLSLAAGRLATLVRTQALLNKIETSSGRQLFDEALADMLAEIKAERAAEIAPAEPGGANLPAHNPEGVDNAA